MDFNRISGTRALVRGVRFQFNNMDQECLVRERLILTCPKTLYIVKCISLPQNNS